MNLDRYDIAADSTTTIFKFTSVGAKEIDKIVIYSETKMTSTYNLGLGDVIPDTGELDDQVVTDNGDTRKILATVAATVLAFFEAHPNAEIIAVGNTESKKWLYRKSVERYIYDFENSFEVKGCLGNTWDPFLKDIAFDAISIT